MLLLCGGGPLLAQRPPDAIAEHFFPPELLHQTHRALDLTAEQEESLKQAVQQTQDRVAPLQERMKDEAARLAEQVKPAKLDEKAVLDQADKVMRLEQDLKRTQLSLLIKIKNTLTPQQQTKLREVKERIPILHEKLREAKALAESWKQAGRDLAPFETMRDEYEALMREGNVREAEALLDETRRRLKESK